MKRNLTCQLLLFSEACVNDGRAGEGKYTVAYGAAPPCRRFHKLVQMCQTFHSCFISYRHPATSDGREARLISQVYKAITDHVQIYTHEHQVFFDEKRLVPGYNYDQQLAQAICRSACMVIVYWPSYLESDYCRKEIQAMLDVEKKRRHILGSGLQGYRLFIPVILRGNYNELPSEITENCQYLDYKAQATQPNVNIGDDQDTSEKLYEVAEYIKSLCDKMKEYKDELFGECQDFAFPLPPFSEASDPIQPPPQQPFPGRS